MRLPDSQDKRYGCVCVTGGPLHLAQAVLVADGSQPALQGGAAVAAGEVGGDGHWRGRQGRAAGRGAPGGEVPPVDGIGAQRLGARASRA